MRARNWCFTINNPSPEDVQALEEIECRYIVYGEEVGKDKTFHYQGYVEFNKSMRFNAVRKLLGDRAHIETRMGTKQQARDYCMKDGKTHERGHFVETGARTDLQEVQSLLDTGVSLLQISEDHFPAWVKYNKAFALYKAMHIGRDLRDVETHIYYGKLGTGKTFKAFTENIDSYILNQSNNGLWFDGYTDQECLIIDDFDGWIALPTLLRILDKYPYRGETKGSFAVACWTKVIITTNTHPDFWYDSLSEALNRRISSIEEFNDTFLSHAGISFKDLL